MFSFWFLFDSIKDSNYNFLVCYYFFIIQIFLTIQKFCFFFAQWDNKNYQTKISNLEIENKKLSDNFDTVFNAHSKNKQKKLQESLK